MAKLSSEHHPAGPGDPPSRRVTRKRHSKTPSFDAPCRSPAKRAASPTSAGHHKRIKRVIVDDHGQLADELDVSHSRHEHEDHDKENENEEEHEEEEDNINVSQASRNHRRRSEPVVVIPDNEMHDTPSRPSASQPLSGLTPHLNRLGLSFGAQTKAKRHARMSMPAHLEASETQGENEVQFVPLRQIIDARQKRKLRRAGLSEAMNEIEAHNKRDSKLNKELQELRRQLREKTDQIRQLEFQQEASRLGEIDMTDDQTQELEEQLAQARQEIEDMKASSIMADASRENTEDFLAGDVGGLSDEEEDDFVLPDPEELGIVQEDTKVETHSNGYYATHALQSQSLSSSQMASQIPESIVDVQETYEDSLLLASQNEPDFVTPSQRSEQASLRFERELGKLNEEIARQKTALRLLVVGLQNLDIVAPGGSSQEILNRLHDMFETARGGLEKLLPGSADGHTNGQLVDDLLKHLQGLMVELREQTTVTESHNRNEKLLRAYLSKLLDLLAESDSRNGELNAKLLDLDKHSDEKSRTILELEETAEQAADELRARQATIDDLQESLNDRDTSLQRLTDAIEQYRADLDNATNTAVRMEEDHKAEIERLNGEHAAAVEELQTQLGNEMNARNEAEEEAAQKSEYIEEMESRISAMEKDADEVNAGLLQLTEELESKKESLATTEAERDEQAQQIYDQQNQIENLQEERDNLNENIAALRQHLEAEQQQRQTTEEDLAAREDEIKALEEALQVEGVQANELRFKIHQTNMEKNEAINQLKDAMAQNATAHLEAIEEADQHRRLLEEQIADLEMQVDNLQDQLTDTEARLTQTEKDHHAKVVDRDERIVELENEVEELKQRYAALENTTNSTITSLQSQIVDLNNTVAARDNTIQHLEDEAVAAAERYDADIAERDTKIEGLEGDLAAARTENEHLAKENASLERRVEAEASEFLNVVNLHANETALLKTTIDTHEATIANMQATLDQHIQEHEEAIADKEQQIEELTMVAGQRAADITALQAQVEEMKEAFRLAEEDTRKTIDTLQDAHRQLMARNDQLAEDLKQRNKKALDSVQELQQKGLHVNTNGVDLHRIANGKVQKVSDKQRVTKVKKSARRHRSVRDSGFGAEIEDEEADNIAAVDAV